MPVRDISFMIRVTVCVNKVGVLLSFVDICTTLIEETLIWALIKFGNFLS